MNRLAARRITNPEDFGHVGLLVGGDSAERDVSLNGGADISKAMDRCGIQHTVFDGTQRLFKAIQLGRIDRVFNLMHGPGGEDGAIQGALQLMQIPITGSGVLGSALSMDKVRSKWVWQHLGIPTAPFVVIDAQTPATDAAAQAPLAEFSWPLFVKPTGLGSSIGISRVETADELAEAIELARRYSDTVVIEEGVSGGEYFVGILDGVALPLIRVETPRPFYDYTAKYQSDDTRYFCPCGLDEATEQRLGQLALDAFHALHLSGWGRVDFILDPAGEPRFLEVNTAPGMTDHSLVPQAAAAIGVDFDELVWRVLETSL
jgi:D-alanine-D-alanine ligase